MRIMCEMCDQNSSRSCIYTDPLTNEWYLDIETSLWDDYDDDWVHEKEYINYCPYCGRSLYKKEEFDGTIS